MYRACWQAASYNGVTAASRTNSLAMDTQLFLDGNSEGLLAKSSHCGPQGDGPSGRLVLEGALQRHTHLTTAAYLGSLKEATTQRPDRISARCLGMLSSGGMRRQACRERSSFILRQLKQTTHVSCRHIYPSDLTLPLWCTQRQ